MKFVANENISAGSRFNSENFVLKRGNGGIAREHLALIKKFTMKVNLKKDEMLEWQHLIEDIKS